MSASLASHLVNRLVCAMLLATPVACQNTDPTTVTVLAATSLTEILGELKTSFEESNPGCSVQLQFAGSHTLSTQINNGAKADVFLSAHKEHVDKVSTYHAYKEPRLVAYNRLVLVTQAKDSDRIRTLRDSSELSSLIFGDVAVPLGRHTQDLLENGTTLYGKAWRTAVEDRVVSKEPNAKLVLSKVVMGVVEGAVVYATDAKLHTSLHKIEMPRELAQQVKYWETVKLNSGDALDAWLRFFRSSKAHATFEKYGFAMPSERKE